MPPERRSVLEGLSWRPMRLYLRVGVAKKLSPAHISCHPGNLTALRESSSYSDTAGTTGASHSEFHRLPKIFMEYAGVQSLVLITSPRTNRKDAVEKRAAQKGSETLLKKVPLKLMSEIRWLLAILRVVNRRECSNASAGYKDVNHPEAFCGFPIEAVKIGQTGTLPLYRPSYRNDVGVQPNTILIGPASRTGVPREFINGEVILAKAPIMRNSLLEFWFNEIRIFSNRKGWHMRCRITVWAFWLWITCGFVPTSVLLAQTSSHQNDLLSLRELSSSLEALTQRVSPAVV